MPLEVHIGTRIGDDPLDEREQILHKIKQLLAPHLRRARSQLNKLAVDMVETEKTLDETRLSGDSRTVSGLIELEVDESAIHF